MNSSLYSSVALKSLKLASVKFLLNVPNGCDRSTFTLGRILKRPLTFWSQICKEHNLKIYDVTNNYYAK